MAVFPGLRKAGFPGVSRLRFGDDLEPGFRAYHLRQSLPFARFALALAIALYALFGILDLYIAPGTAGWIWVIRYAVVCPAVLAVLGFTFTRWFRPVMQPVLAGTAALVGLGIVAMIAIARPPADYLYYAGLLLVIPWAYTLAQLRFTYATRACLAIMIGYEAVAIGLKSTSADLLINNNFFFFAAVIIGMVAGYVIERGLRTEFLQRRLIESQRAELAAHNARLDSALQASLEELRRKAAELQASRARIVAAADGERRRIERNLHDGVQQHLTALAVKASLALDLSEAEPGEARELLAELCSEAADTARELRDLAHGIYPPLLRGAGLSAALPAAARLATMPVTVEAGSLGRYPAEVEATVYFCCLEALHNACKHAGEGATLALRVREDTGMLVFDVTDNGSGFDAGDRASGAGFVNMTDRLGALGGSIQVHSVPGQGTRVSGTLPLAATSTRPAGPAGTAAPARPATRAEPRVAPAD